jgi:hypothetical protein
VPVRIDDKNYYINPVNITVPSGYHTVGVPHIIVIKHKEISAKFLRWSDGQVNGTNEKYVDRRIFVSSDNDTDLYAVYEIRYSLLVNSSLLGNSSHPTGTGWYNAGGEAQFRVNPWPMFFLCLCSFDHWQGDNNTILTIDYTVPAGSISMDGPKKLTAMWKFDFGYLAIVVGLITAVALPVLRKFRPSYFKALHILKRKNKDVYSYEGWY